MSQAKTFKQLNDELEEVISNLQSSDLGVDQVVKEYEKGIELVSQLERYLASAQNKIKRLSQKK